MSRFIFPSIMGLLAAGQGIYCAVEGDWRRAGYWGSCVAITFFFTV